LTSILPVKKRPKKHLHSTSDFGPI